MRLSRGQGPGEHEEISGATIASDNVVYLAEPNQAKLLRINTSKGPLEDHPLYESGSRLESRFRPGRIKAWESQLVATGVSATEFMGVIGTDGVFRQADGLNVEAEFGSNPFLQGGRLDATGHRAFFLTRYRPRIYVFDLRRNQSVKKIVYADVDVEVETPDHKSTESGVKAFFPPQEVPLLSREVVAVPKRSDRVLIQAEGGDGDHSFNPSVFYEIDVRTETIVAEHDLEHKVDLVASADTCLYIYDDQRREIFKYRLRSSER